MRNNTVAKQSSKFLRSSAFLFWHWRCITSFRPFSKLSSKHLLLLSCNKGSEICDPMKIQSSMTWHDRKRHLYWIEWIKWVAGDVTVFLRHAWDDADIFQSTFFYVFLLKYLPRIALFTFNILKQSWDESTDWALPNRIEARMSVTRLEHSSAEDECSCNEFGVKRSWTNFRELSDRQSCNDILEKSVKQSMQQIMSFLIGILAHSATFLFGA